MMFWFTGVILIGGSMFIMAIRDFMAGSETDGEWLALVVPPLMIAGGTAMVAVGRWLGRNERPFLTDFIKTTLSAS
jgi:hypothetical protein